MVETKQPNFEQAMQQLEELVTKLERADMPLNDALEAFEKGVGLVKTCKDQLSAAEKRVEKLVKTDKGIQAEPLDV